MERYLGGVVIALLMTMMMMMMEADVAWGEGLYVGYHDGVCPRAEGIVQACVAEAVARDRGVAAGLLHLHFHDCFVRGCDASVLLDSVAGEAAAEKDSPANTVSFRGADVVDECKRRVEAACPSAVSCADILAFAARDAVNLVGGPSWPVPAGRMDGNMSLASEVGGNLASPFFDMEQLTEAFEAKGLSKIDLVTLSGAHTIGQAHCSSFINRLYHFSPTDAQDPSLDPSFANSLKKRCPSNIMGKDKAVQMKTVIPMDGRTPTSFDNSYYTEVKQGRGLFMSDAALAKDPMTFAIIQTNSMNQFLWFNSFSDAMYRLSQITDDNTYYGEIRKSCRFRNSNNNNY